MNVYLDIETIPTQLPIERQRIADAVKPPGNMSKPETIAKWWEEECEAARDEAWRKTALSGDWGEIVCACYAVGNGPVWRVVRKFADEPELLGLLFRDIATGLRGQHPTFVGHKIGFDLRFLHHRSVVHQVKPSFWIPYNSAPWQGKYTDTMYEWVGAKGGIKLTELCRILGIDVGHEDTIDGSMVADCWEAGDIDTIVNHCAADVERVRAVHRRLRYEG